MTAVGYKCASGATGNLVRCTPSFGPSRVDLPLSPATDPNRSVREGPHVTPTGLSRSLSMLLISALQRVAFVATKIAVFNALRAG